MCKFGQPHHHRDSKVCRAGCSCTSSGRFKQEEREGRREGGRKEGADKVYLLHIRYWHSSIMVLARYWLPSTYMVLATGGS